MLNKCCQNRVQQRKKKSQIAVLQQFGIDFERCLAESNRCSRFCRPVPNRSAKAPFPYWDCKYSDFYRICKIIFRFFLSRTLWNVKKESLVKQAGAQCIVSQVVTQTACRQKGARGFRKTLIISDIGINIHHIKETTPHKAGGP